MNLGFTHEFGYFQKDIKGLTLDNILYSIYKPYTHDYLIHLSNTNEKKSEIFYVKTKNGYMVSTVSKISKVSFFGEDSQFLIALKPIKDRHKAFIVTDLNLKIIGLNPGANSLLGLSKKIILKHNIILENLCPELFINNKADSIKSPFKKFVKYNMPSYTKEEFDYYGILSTHYNFENRIKKNLSSVISFDISDDSILVKVIVNPIKYYLDKIIGFAFNFSLKEDKHTDKATIIEKSYERPSIIIYEKNVDSYVRKYDSIDDEPEDFKSMSTLSNLRSFTIFKFIEHVAGKNLGTCKAKFEKTHIDYFNTIVANQIYKIRLKLKFEDLSKFDNYISEHYNHSNYSKYIKTYRITNPKEQLENDRPSFLIDRNYQTVVDKRMKCPGNILLKKQSEAYRLRLMLYDNSEIEEFILSQFSFSKLLIFFLIFLGVVNINFIGTAIFKKKTISILRFDLLKSFDYATYGFSRIYINLMTANAISCSIYLNQ